jgi:hypothetical protein
MKKIILLFALLVSFCLADTAPGKSLYQGEEELKVEAERGFGEILDLWHNGKYEELFDRTEGGGNVTREDFTDRLVHAPYHPACCWEKLRDVRVVLKNDDSARIRAKVGLEGQGRSFTSTRDYRLVREDGVWLIAMKDILNMSGGGKKKVPHAKKKKLKNRKPAELW